MAPRCPQNFCQPVDLQWPSLYLVLNTLLTSPSCCPAQWITRTDTKGGQPPSPTCTMAENGTTEGIDYAATFKFWMC